MSSCSGTSFDRDVIRDFSVKDDTIYVDNALFKAFGVKTGALCPLASSGRARLAKRTIPTIASSSKPTPAGCPTIRTAQPM